MDWEDLNTQLYEKMIAEQKTYRDADLMPRQCRALLKSDSPLADVYAKIGKRDNSDYMEMVADAVECRANEIIRDDFKRSREEAR